MSLRFRDYFYFHPKERTALVFLLMLNCTLFALREGIEYYSLNIEEHSGLAEFPSFEHDMEASFSKLQEKSTLSDSPDKVEPIVLKKPLARQWTEVKDKAKIGLNNADREELEELPLIGPSRASEILKYRELLGGFYRLEQLLEVYTIDSSVYSVVLPFLEVRDSSWRKVNIDEVEFKSLLKHPYFDYPLVKSIFQLRDKGRLESLSQLKTLDLMNDSIYVKIEPYLFIEKP